MNLSDTIAAISTPKGEGAIGIVRISGEQARAILQRIFIPHRNINGPFLFEAHRMIHGSIVDGTEALDDVLMVWMPQGASYTGEDVVEIHAHGNPFVLNEILGLISKSGARLAQPGEFTFRAFMNGRIDLAQAEAVSSIISAKSRQALQIANQHLRGVFSKEITEIREELLEILVHTEAAIDFSSEDIEVFSMEEMVQKLRTVCEKTEKILATYQMGRLLSTGATVVIIGRPNVGKSSLFNACLNLDRAIVTDIPGTTRDTVEEEFVYQGLPVRLVDTAGIREVDNIVEKIGVNKTLEKIRMADLVLIVLDVSEDFSDEAWTLIDSVATKKKILILNKIDLGEKWKAEDIFKNHLDLFPIVCRVSAATKDGIERVLASIYEQLIEENTNSATVFLTRTRHKVSLENALRQMEIYENGLKERLPLELLTLELKGAVHELEAIIGTVTTEDIYDKLFSSFCIGK